MAIIHQTTLVPSKLELLTQWLPEQLWYQVAAGHYLADGSLRAAPPVPQLTRAGGFRLDDPAGEVGVEFMIVLDTAGDLPRAYLVPMTYRASPLPDWPGRAAGAPDPLIGTSEHGVLGTRYIYFGPSDRVLAEQVLELVRGRARPQAQSVSDTEDPTIAVRPVADDRVRITFAQVLEPLPQDGGLESFGPPEAGLVAAPWTAADGSGVRSVVITAQPI